MPPKGIKQERRLCPLCSKEIAAGYMWLHKKQYCPMRPTRQEEIKAEAMGLQIVPSQDVNYGESAMRVATPATLSPINYDNITSIDLMEEYNKMVKIMKKKQDEEVEIGEEFQCADCNGTFYAKKQPKHCPECGIEFA